MIKLSMNHDKVFCLALVLLSKTVSIYPYAATTSKNAGSPSQILTGSPAKLA